MKGKKVALGVTDPRDEAAAWAALKQLLRDAAGEAVAAQRANGRVGPGTIAELVPRFLDDRRPLVEPKTLKDYGILLKWFVREFGKETAAGLDVRALVVRAAGEKRWGETHRANVLGTCAQLLRWAGRTEAVPLPPKASRGADSVIPEDVYRRCLDLTWGDFRALIRFLWHTGCRPGEATGITAESVHWEAGTVRVRDHKTRKKGKTRTIYPDPEALAVLSDQRDRHGDGLLFRDAKLGGRWTVLAVTKRFIRLSEKLGRRVRAYDFRHSFCSRALAAGFSDAQVAALVGHASTAMIHKHYSHISQNARLMKDIAERVWKAGLDGRRTG